MSALQLRPLFPGDVFYPCVNGCRTKDRHRREAAFTAKILGYYAGELCAKCATNLQQLWDEARTRETA